MCTGAEAPILLANGMEVAATAAAVGEAAGGAAALAGSMDAIEAINTAMTITGAETATPAAAALGFGSVESMVGAVNPAWVSGAGILGNLKEAATILSPTASLVSAASGLSASERSGVLSRPAVRPSAPMPILGQQTGAQRSAVVDQATRRGRAATILTQPNAEKFGS